MCGGSGGDGGQRSDLNISEAIIGDAGATLVEAISSSSTLNFITIGKGLRLPLKDNYVSDVLDASKKGIEHGGVAVIAWWLTTSAAAAVNTVVLSQNKIGGRAVASTSDATPTDTPKVGCVYLEDGEYYEIVSIEDGMTRQKVVKTGEMLRAEFDDCRFDW